MIYESILILHSIVRWFVLASLVFALYRAYSGLLSSRAFTSIDENARKAALNFSHLQFTLGIILYIFSPIVRYFLSNFSEGIHIRDMRFFGLEHITMMVIAVGMITAGNNISRKKGTDRGKFRAMAVWFTIGLIIILISIPWKFSPFTARPYWRFW